MEVNYIAILVCGAVAMVIGGVWYGPIFGRLWMRLNNLNPEDIAKREAMQKSAGPLYVVQFLLLLLQLYILSHFVAAWTDVHPIETAIWIWLGFVMPTIAGACMWNMNNAKVKWTMFLLQAGYQLICFIVFGFILGVWL